MGSTQPVERTTCYNDESYGDGNVEPVNFLSFQVDVEGEVRRTTQTRLIRSVAGWLKKVKW